VIAAAVHVVGLLGGRPVGDAALEALRGARLVAGGREQLEAVGDLIGDGVETTTVAGGLAALDEVAGHTGPACVLASGDPGFHGIVRALAARVGPERLVVHPAPSSVALAFARLGLPWDDAVVTSCHTGDAAGAAAQVAHAPVAAVLCGPDARPEAVGAALLARGAHHPTVVVASRLGETGEALHRLPDLAALAAGSFDHRSVVVLAHADQPVRVAARPVSAFHHRAGMITKPEVRSVVLAHLDLPARGVLWDVGAGSGSVAIDAALAAPGLRVVAVERDPDAADTIVSNAAALGAVLEVVVGVAPEVLAGLPTPDRVFVGGGGLDVLDACLAAAAPSARVVATFAAVDRAVAARGRLGNLVQVSVDRARDLPDGGVRFEADNPVFVAWGEAPSEPPSEAPASREATGVVRVVGLGPGGAEQRTPAAVRAVREADVVVGYGPYVDAASSLLRPEQEVVRSTMGAEAERALVAVDRAAAGAAVAVVSSGDPGVFAMASVTLELAAERGVRVEVVPGVTAANAAAAAVGAPLAGPHVALTLSDLLVPWERIEAQLRAAAAAGLALALFNPRSQGRPDHLARARAVLASILEPSTPVAVVTDATGPDETVTITDLAGLDPTIAGMRSLVLVGTTDTAVLGNRLVTPRHHPRPARASEEVLP
jgi:precorrin-6Y C5,15-methyltransferase (decarboxylating)